MDYWLNDTASDSTMNFTTNGDMNCTSTIYLPDPLIDWFPNSCLYTKYVPTWHLVRSYR